MTFEEWIVKEIPKSGAEYRMAKAAWDAATKAEREACAKVCDTTWNGDADTYEYTEACNECAEAIRMRSDNG